MGYAQPHLRGKCLRYSRTKPPYPTKPLPSQHETTHACTVELQCLFSSGSTRYGHRPNSLNFSSENLRIVFCFVRFLRIPSHFLQTFPAWPPDLTKTSSHPWPSSQNESWASLSPASKRFLRLISEYSPRRFLACYHFHLYDEGLVKPAGHPSCRAVPHRPRLKGQVDAIFNLHHTHIAAAADWIHIETVRNAK